MPWASERPVTGSSGIFSTRWSGGTTATGKVTMVPLGSSLFSSPSDLYAAILKSRSVGEELLRRFDLIEPSASPMIMKARVVDQNLPMPDNIRLFIFKTANEGPTWGRYVAQFFRCYLFRKLPR